MSTEHVTMSDKTIEELNHIKDDAESYDEIVAQLVEEHKKARLVANVRDSMKNDDFVPLDEL